MFEYEGYRKGFASFKPEAVLRVGCLFSEAYFKANVEAHRGPVTRLDISHVREWSTLHGVDAVTALDLDRKGLSRTACLCSSCPYYLKALGPSNMPGKVSPALKAHLVGVPVVPGLHKAVFERFPMDKGEELEAYVKRLSELLRSGEHLNLVHPEAAKMAKTGLCSKTKDIAQRIMKYSEEMRNKIYCDYNKPGELEEAVRTVLRAPVLSRSETFDALQRAFGSESSSSTLQ